MGDRDSRPGARVIGLDLFFFGRTDHAEKQVRNLSSDEFWGEAAAGNVVLATSKGCRQWPIRPLPVTPAVRQPLGDGIRGLSAPAAALRRCLRL